MLKKLIVALVVLGLISIFIVSSFYFIDKNSREDFVGEIKRVTIFFNKAFLTLPDGKRIIVDIPKKGMSVAFLSKDNKYPKEVEEDDIKRIRNIKIMDEKALIYLKEGGKEIVNIKEKRVLLIIIPFPDA